MRDKSHARFGDLVRDEDSPRKFGVKESEGGCSLNEGKLVETRSRLDPESRLLARQIANNKAEPVGVRKRLQRNENGDV